MRFSIVILLLAASTTAQQRGRASYGKDDEYDMPNLPEQRFIFQDRLAEEGPMYRSFSNKSCQLVCRGSLAINQQPGQQYLRYHRVNLTDCFNAPQYTQMPINYNASYVTKLNGGPSAKPSKPEIFERFYTKRSYAYNTGEFYMDFGVFLPRQRVDGRIFVDWEVRRNISEEQYGTYEKSKCDWQIRYDQEQARDEKERRKEERKDSESGKSWENNSNKETAAMDQWWRLDRYIKMEEQPGNWNTWTSQYWNTWENNNNWNNNNWNSNSWNNNNWNSNTGGSRRGWGKGNMNMKRFEMKGNDWERFERILNRGWY